MREADDEILSASKTHLAATKVKLPRKPAKGM